MPRPRARLEIETRREAFTVDQARRLGATASVLRHSRYVPTFHGLRSTRPALAGGAAIAVRVERSAADFAPRLHAEEAFSHTTALLLLGCPIRCDPILHVTAPPGRNRRRRRGVVGHRSGSAPELRRTRSGLPVVDPVLALRQSTALLPFRELVVALDHLVRVPRFGGAPPGATLEDLRAGLASRPGRGAVRLSWAARFARVGAESRMETLTRLLAAEHGLDGGLELQCELFDGAGEWIGRFDLVDRRRRAVFEYDGEQHRTDRAQYLRDERRLERVREGGYRVLRLHAEDVLLRPGATVRRMAELLGLPLRPRPAEVRRLLHEAVGPGTRGGGPGAGVRGGARRPRSSSG